MDTADKVSVQRYAEYLARFALIDLDADETPMSYRQWLEADQEYQDMGEDHQGRDYIASDELKRYWQLEWKLRWRPAQRYQGRIVKP